MSVRPVNRSLGSPRLPVRRLAESVGLHVAVIAGGMLLSVPFVYAATRALMTSAQAMAIPIEWIPSPLDLSSFADGIAGLGWRSFLNSTILAVCAIVGQTVFGMMAAFAIATLRFRLSSPILLVYVAELLVPFQVIMIPLFVLVFQIGWVNTYPGLIVPVVASQALAVFFFRQHFLSIPYELFEAAMIDGASPGQILRHIYAPLSRAPISAYAVVTFLGAYNLFVWPFLVASDRDLRTVVLQLAHQNTSEVQPNDLLAMSILSMAPVLVVFLLAQRRFVEGITGTGIKG